MKENIIFNKHIHAIYQYFLLNNKKCRKENSLIFDAKNKTKQNKEKNDCFTIDII